VSIVEASQLLDRVKTQHERMAWPTSWRTPSGTACPGHLTGQIRKQAPAMETVSFLIPLYFLAHVSS